MAKNYIQEGKNITITAPYTVASGGGCLVGTLFGVALADIANGEQGVIATEGVWELTKAVADGGIDIYGDVYWDNTAKKVTGVSSSNTLIGNALAVAATGAATAIVRLRAS